MTTGHQVNRRGIVALALSVLMVAGSSGVALCLTATVDRDTVRMGECLVLTVSTSGADGAPRPHLPDITAFRNLRGSWMQSVRSHADSVDVRTVSYVCLLQPRRTGLLTIGPAVVEAGGTTCATQPITIVVTDDKQPTGRSVRDGIRSARAVLRASVDPETAWVGQQVTVSYTLYAESTLFGLTLKHAPEYTGFWSEPLFDGWDLVWRADSFNHHPCRAALVKRVALFATQPGVLDVGEMTLAGAVAGTGGTLPGAFELFNVSSGTRSVTVRALPDEGRPADFSGGVGDFTLEANLDRRQSGGSEPLKLDVRIAGTGSISTVGEPQLTTPAGALILSSGNTQQVTHMAGIVAGTRTQSYAIQPRADGRCIIPAITMSFFDPVRGRYYTRATAPEAFVATGVMSPATDIRHIKQPNSGPANQSASAWLFGPFYPAGLAVFAAGFLTGRHRRRLDTDRGYARRSRSGPLVKQRLSEATRLLAEGNEREFYSALNRAIVGYVGDRYNVEAFGLTCDQVRGELLRRAVPLDTVDAVLALSAACDAARFSSEATPGGPRETLEHARTILERLG